MTILRLLEIVGYDCMMHTSKRNLNIEWP